MELKETLAALKAAGTEANRNIYQRHGASTSLFGVSYANIEKLAKQIKQDQVLAAQLWQTGISDAQILGAYIADPALASAKELDEWANSADWYGVADTLVGKVAVKSPHAPALMRKWLKSRKEFVRRAGFHLASALLAEEGTTGKVEAREYGELLKVIEKEIHQAPNRTREGMHNALIGLGSYGDKKPYALAIAAAGRIGKVDIDHGETGCKTPDAITYINKTVQYREARAAKTATAKPAAGAKAKSAKT